jgi:hypothetical protein
LYDDSTVFHVVVAVDALLLATLLPRVVQLSQYHIVKSHWSIDRPLLSAIHGHSAFSRVDHSSRALHHVFERNLNGARFRFQAGTSGNILIFFFRVFHPMLACS